MKKTKTSAGAAPRTTTKKPAAVETPAAKPAVAVKPAAAAKSAETDKAAEVPKPVAPVKRAKPAGPQPTVIQANVDIGFGNSLYVRGEGPGLSWDRGVIMDCVKDDLWAFTIAAAARPIVFKFLVNDETWCTGDDYVVEPGNKITLVPTL